jgi:hypothetical protein
MILGEFLNLTFERELAAGGTQMSNSLHYRPHTRNIGFAVASATRKLR